MISVNVRELNSRDEGAFLFGARRCKTKEDLSWYTFHWNWDMPFEKYLQILADYKAGRNLPAGRVPDSMLYGFLENQIIGRVSIRHELDAHLLKRGGHFGYWIHPDFRGHGYGYEMVRQALPSCRSLGIKKALVTCAETNLASIRIIEKLGAVLENKVHDDEENEMIRRYWLNL